MLFIIFDSQTDSYFQVTVEIFIVPILLENNWG